jgi:predicted nucleic acid-binding protein
VAYVVDTNILLRGLQPHHPLHGEVVAALTTLLRQGETLAFLPQNIREFWNVATRPVAHNGLGFTPAQVDGEVTRIEALLTLLLDHPATYAEWRRLVVAHAVSGVQVHDAYLVAAMNVHGISHILTLNEEDFARYPGITVVHPRQVVAHP